MAPRGVEIESSQCPQHSVIERLLGKILANQEAETDRLDRLERRHEERFDRLEEKIQGRRETAAADSVDRPSAAWFWAKVAGGIVVAITTITVAIVTTSPQIIAAVRAQQPAVTAPSSPATTSPMANTSKP
jgi:hypothetical protein